MPVRFRCPNSTCNKLLSISRRKIGHKVACPNCSKSIIVPQLAAQFGPPPDEDAIPVREPAAPANAPILIPARANRNSSNLSRLQQILIAALVVTGIAILLTITLFAAGNWMLGTVLLLATLFLAGMLLKGSIEVLTAKARAIRRGERELDLLFKCVKLVLWEQNEGLLFLKNKRIHQVVYGPEQGGGMRFIFPVLGDEIRLHVPLTLQMSQFKDDKVLTRESIQLHVKVALWWRIKDRQGLEDFYLLIDKEIHLADDASMRAEVVADGAEGAGVRKGPKRAELNAAERWMLTLVESCLRKLVSKTSVAWVISKRAADYLQVGTQPAAPTAEALIHHDDNQNTPDLIGKTLRDMLAAELEDFGLEIQKVEIQEVRLPQPLQNAIDRVWEATLQPSRTEQEALARSNLIKAELKAVKEVIGDEATAKGYLLDKLQGMTFYPGVQQTVEQLLSLIPTTQNAPPQLPNSQPAEMLDERVQP